MIKIITYGTYDLLHYGHLNLLKRAKALGDYLIVGVTSDDFDKARGKINVQQTLMERIAGVRDTGLADEIIVEEYEGQKIDDILRFAVDIFTVGSDWAGKFDYLTAYCKVIYLPRTEGVSSSGIRTKERMLRLGLMGESVMLRKAQREAGLVNGLSISGLCTQNVVLEKKLKKDVRIVHDYEELLALSDAIYVASVPRNHFHDVERAILAGKHVLCESPIALSEEECKHLLLKAQGKNLVLMEGCKTAYSTAFHRLRLLVHSGAIGKVTSIDATCTSLRDIDLEKAPYAWNSICEWGPTAMLPIFQLLGTNYVQKTIMSRFLDKTMNMDLFTAVHFIYEDAIAAIKVGLGVKSEGELVISGTKGYIYVPAPWWKTDYFEIRYENPANNRRYFYPLEGEGIRYELVAFLKSIEKGNVFSYIDQDVSMAIAKVMENFMEGNMFELK